MHKCGDILGSNVMGSHFQNKHNGLKWGEIQFSIQIGGQTKFTLCLNEECMHFLFARFTSFQGFGG
jgi:hypothetical protein